MPRKRFIERLVDRQRAAQSLLCVGLDPDVRKMPSHLLFDRDVESAIVEFNRQIIEATTEHVCAFKLNLAFFEVHGVAGWRALERTVSMIPDDVLKIADGKRGDIGNTARFYASSVFDTLEFDACTVAPYMGIDAVGPFLEYADKATFILCRTSNESADDLQLFGDSGKPLYHHVAESASRWDTSFAGQVGLVVGATRPTDLKISRSLAPSLPFLIPGVGAQGGSPGETVLAGRTANGPIIVNSSRSILYAGSGAEFANDAAAAAAQLRKSLV